LKEAEHAAALEVLNKLEIDFEFQNASLSQNESPQKSEIALGKSQAAELQNSDSSDQQLQVSFNDQVHQI